MILHCQGIPLSPRYASAYIRACVCSLMQYATAVRVRADSNAGLVRGGRFILYSRRHPRIFFFQTPTPSFWNAIVYQKSPRDCPIRVSGIFVTGGLFWEGVYYEKSISREIKILLLSSFLVELISVLSVPLHFISRWLNSTSEIFFGTTLFKFLEIIPWNNASSFHFRFPISLSSCVSFA